MPAQEIYFHIGMERTATSYLQKKVFPRFNNIHYIPKKDYKNKQAIINRSGHNRYLLTYELPPDMESELKQFAQHYPKAKIIIVIRRQDQWIASQYKRYLKNGQCVELKDLLDLKHDKGYWKKTQLLFYPKLQFIEQLFGQKPCILFYEDLKKDPVTFINRFAAFIGASYDSDTIPPKPFHVSYSEKQLIVLKNIRKKTMPEFLRTHDKKLKNKIKHKYALIARYTILTLAQFIPVFLLKEKKLIHTDTLSEIANYYKDDWEKCKSAGENQQGI